MEDVTGYLHPAYAESLSAIGTPRILPGSGGTILQRRVSGSNARDAMGPYPIFACRDWSLLTEDVEDLRGELAALSLVTDPFGDYSLADLRRCFTDKCVPFKDHFVVDLSCPLEGHLHPHHRRNVARALRAVEVERVTDIPALLEDWTALYDLLVETRGIEGIPAFSKEAFAKQLRVPGLVAFRAEDAGQTVGINLWYLQRGVAYYHLGASSADGYRVGASFALFWRAIEHFAASGLAWADLGGGVGVRDRDDGLSRFKRGWSTGARVAYFCGVILSPEAYRDIVRSKAISPTNYFPAYREGEFE